jgi:aminocarboxycyclopropane-forming enzyme
MEKHHIDHVAFATTETDKSVEIFAILGFKQTLFHKEKIEKFDSYITKLQSANGQIVELVEPCTEKSVVHTLLKGQTATIYHSAFLTDNLQETLIQLKAAGAVVITEPMSIPYPATPAHENYKTSHVYHPNVGLFEVTGPLKE